MKKQLSLRFERSISAASGRPDVLEVTVTPLNGASSATDDATFIDGPITKKVRLANALNVVTFDLVPSYQAGLTQPILYRVAWRMSMVGRITQHDFAMPDRDVSFDDLEDMGSVIDGQNYLKEEDLGVAGRVARLDPEGRVLDGNGNPIDKADLTEVRNLIGQETRSRQSEDARIARDLTFRIETQINSIANTLTLRLGQEEVSRTAAIKAEAEIRRGIDDQISATLAAFTQQTTTSFAGVNATLADHASRFAKKADLVNGVIPTSQLPSIALGTSVNVADEAAMLALTPAQVQPGDFAIQASGQKFFLSKFPATDLANWVPFNSSGNVDSVNGQTGVVVLGAEDVGARAADMSIPMADVNGLGAALGLKANSSALATTNSNVTGLTTKLDGVDGRLTTLDGKAVKVNTAGEITTSLLGTDVPRIDANNVLRRKDGSVIPVSGGGGANLVEDPARPGVFIVSTGGGTGGGTGGAVASVNGKVGTVVLTASDVAARPSGVPVPIGDVDTLVARLAGKVDGTDLQSTNTRVSRLETRVADIEANGGGGGTGGGTSSATTVSWVADDNTDPKLVSMRSPFGINGTVPYYDPLGSAEGEAAYPYVSRNGHLELRKLNPAAEAEPDPVSVPTFNALSTRVKAIEDTPGKPASGWLKSDLEQTVQNTLTRVEGATASSSGDSLVLRNSSGTFAVSEPQGTNHPATKGYTDTALGLKADKTTVNALTTTVGTKAAQGDVTALAGRVTNVEGTLPNKADLDTSSTVPVAQIPTLPGTKVTGFASKADLDGTGKLSTSQIPSSIPQANITNLVSTLLTKADLVNGKLPTSQLPALATGEVVTVANRAAMLALTSAQVQRGDIAVINGTADAGNYILNADDPSVFGNWVLMYQPSGSVASVNGQTGVVVLGASDVGARPVNVALPQSEITNLTTDLAAKAATSYVDTQVATRTTAAQVTTQINQQSVSKAAADFVATAAVTLSGAQSIDGSLVGAGKIVLLTAQSASSQNGRWVVATGAWTRATDAPDGSNFSPNTLVIVKSGAAHSNSIWQLTTTSTGVVGTNAQNWSKILQGGPPVVYTGGNGIEVTGTAIAARLGAGLIFSGGAIAIDPATSLRKYTQVIPSGNTTATITHNLGTRAVIAQIYDTATGDLVLAGVTAVSTSAVTVEFKVAPGDNQYEIVIVG